jgi:hypothetical protein
VFANAQVKDRVYKNRIRIQDFFADFDKLRCGSITFHQVRPPTACAALAPTHPLGTTLNPTVPIVP